MANRLSRAISFSPLGFMQHVHAYKKERHLIDAARAVSSLGLFEHAFEAEDGQFLLLRAFVSNVAFRAELRDV